MDYTLENGEFYKVLDKDSGELIIYGQLIPDQVLSTIHQAIWITEQEYNDLLQVNPYLVIRKNRIS